MTMRRGMKCGRMSAAVAIIASVPAAVRADRVTGAPSPVIIAIGFVVTTDVTHADAAADAIDGATRKQHQGECARQADRALRAPHFGSVFVSLLLHSIRPTGAPAGSATTDTVPP